MGFQRGLDHLLDLGADVGVMVTDRSPSIRKMMREKYGNIRHEYDPWHVNKGMYHISCTSFSTRVSPVLAVFIDAHVVFVLCLGLKKKLVTISNKKGNRELGPWVRSITNHLYWACSSSHGDGQVTIYASFNK